MDLGVAAGICDGGFWNDLYQALVRFGGDFDTYFSTQRRRRDSFMNQRAGGSDSGSMDWRDRPKDAIRQMLGFLIGEPPPLRRSDPVYALTPAA